MGPQRLSAASTAGAVGISVWPAVHAGFLEYAYMMFGMSASLWCVLRGEGKKVATGKRERSMEDYVDLAFEIRKLRAGELTLKPAYKCHSWSYLGVIMNLAAVYFCSLCFISR